METEKLLNIIEEYGLDEFSKELQLLFENLDIDSEEAVLDVLNTSSVDYGEYDEVVVASLNRCYSILSEETVSDIISYKSDDISDEVKSYLNRYNYDLLSYFDMDEYIADNPISINDFGDAIVHLEDDGYYIIVNTSKRVNY